MRGFHKFLGVVVACMTVSAAYAQSADAVPQLASDPAAESVFDRITADLPELSILTTKEKEPAKPQPSSASPNMVQPAPMATEQKAHAPFERAGPAAPLPKKIPFGRGEAASMPVIPSGPHKTEAVPLVNVDAVETSEAAPPTPIEPEADPVQENPEEPTELTSPIFEEEIGTLKPRTIMLRALNKVTAQSEVITLKPQETTKFGQLSITAVTCRVSSPTSQTDYAGLFDIVERLPAPAQAKPLFHGWMYASSPSITALEHPVYDVTMVKCDMMPSSAKKDEKSAPKADSKKGDAPAKKAKH